MEENKENLNNKESEIPENELSSKENAIEEAISSKDLSSEISSKGTPISEFDSDSTDEAEDTVEGSLFGDDIQEAPEVTEAAEAVGEVEEATEEATETAEAIEEITEVAETVEANETIEEIKEETVANNNISPALNSDIEIEANESVDFNDYDKSAEELVTVRPVKFQEFEDAPPNRSIKKNLDIMQDISMHISVELGRTKSSIREVMEMEKGSIVELEKIAGEQVEIYVNEKLVAKGEVIVIEDKFGVRVTSTNLAKSLNN